jgi:hypothetical protein
MQVPRYLLTKKSEPFTWSMLRTLTSVAIRRQEKLYHSTFVFLLILPFSSCSILKTPAEE